MFRNMLDAHFVHILICTTKFQMVDFATVENHRNICCTLRLEVGGEHDSECMVGLSVMLLDAGGLTAKMIARFYQQVRTERSSI